LKPANEEKIISAMLECKTLADVSRLTETPPRTLYTILQDKTFKEKLNAAKSSMLGQAVAKLNNFTSMAVDILATIAQDTEQNGQVRVSACRSLLDAVTRLNEQADILARLDELERIQAENSRK
jgi:hypothetical protein